MDVVAALQQVNAPYQLHAGTLLGFARDCRLKSDIDFAIPRKWFRQDKSGNNEDSLKKAMGARGFKFMYSIGKIDEFGYELSFKRLEIKVDFFTIDEAEATFHWGYWGKPSGLHRCTVNRTAVRGDFRWGNLTNLRMPVPFDAVLTSLYSRDWRTPVDKWDFLDIFRIGSCDPKGSQSTVSF